MAKILLAGVAVLDFIFNVEEFPRTAEKYRAEGAEITGGGNAANAAVAIARLGGHAILATRLGDDPIADLIENDLKSEQVDTALVRRFPQHRSSFSSIYIDQAGERQIMNYRDLTLSMDADWLTASPPADMKAVLTDTRWPQGALAAMQLAKKHNVPGVIDAEAPVSEAIDAVEQASHVAFSAQGASDFTGEEDAEAAALSASKKLDGIVMVTDGGRGTVAVINGKPQWFPAAKVVAVDSLAAGDVWHGAFTLALAEEQPLGDAIEFANAAASLKCTRSGGRNGAPDRNEVTRFMQTIEGGENP